MFGPVLLAALLASGPAPGLEADAASLRRELDAVAGRIEVLKSRRLSGESVEGELWPLLVRSQELASELERLRPEANTPPAGQSPEDTARERADELLERASLRRDEADRLLRACAALDGRILAALRSATTAPAEASAGAPRAAPTWATIAGAGQPASDPRSRNLAIAPLLEQRMQLELRARMLEAEASRLEREAQALLRDVSPPTPVPEPAR